MSKLYLVPTPIGNLEDITLRALRILKEVDGILAEDTRVTKKLLQHYDINQQVFSFHQNNEHKALDGVVNRLRTGATLALVSDAGTPGISDPGFLLARECIREGIEIETLTGATAFVPALVNSGLPCDRFVFEGFLPHKKGRQTKLDLLVEEERTIVLYESPHRLLKTLKQLEERCTPEREISVSREISKKFEETVRGTISEVFAHFEEKGVKGEFVIVLAGKS
ncbi:16S rRNA (cytidine(1402)-2'-O)-methyltransferase [Halocola ammonii]